MHQPRALRALLLVAACAAALTGPTAGPARGGRRREHVVRARRRHGHELHLFFELEVNPGVRVRDRVVLENRSQQRQTYDIYPADATSVDGAFVLSGADANPRVWARGWSCRCAKWCSNRRSPARSPSRSKSRRTPRPVTRPAASSRSPAPPRPSTIEQRPAPGPVRSRRAGVREGEGTAPSRADGIRPDHRPSGWPQGRAPRRRLGDGELSGRQLRQRHPGTSSDGQVTTRTSTIDLAERQLGEMLPGSTSVVTEQVDGLRWAACSAGCTSRSRSPPTEPTRSRSKPPRGGCPGSRSSGWRSCSRWPPASG